MSGDEKKRNPGKLILKIIVAFILVLIIAAAFNYDYLTRLYKGITLFEPEHIEDNFRNMEEIVPAVTVSKGGAC